jgi:Tfp pilus assembly protein PilO
LKDDAATGTTSTAGRSALRARLEGFRGARRRGPLGLPEVLALAAAASLLLLTVFAYLFLLVPQRSRLQSLEVERGDLQHVIQSTEHVVGGQKDSQQRAGEILASLNSFEVEHLGQASSANGIIDELNRLILKNNLRISGGISYTQLQEAAPGAQPGQTQRRAGTDETQARVVQSIFPGIGVTLTVEGTYANLRRFIRDIEADRQFVVVNTVELEGVSDSAAAHDLAATASETAQPAPLTATRPQTPTTPRGATSTSRQPVVNPEGPTAPGAQTTAQPGTPTRGALVSLRLDMAAYFRRAASE